MNARTPEPNAHAYLPAGVQAQIDQLKQGWMYVGSAFQSGSEHCDGCKHSRLYADDERYGDGWVQRTSTACTLGEYASDMPTDCPAYLAHLEDTKEEA